MLINGGENKSQSLSFFFFFFGWLFRAGPSAISTSKMWAERLYWRWERLQIHYKKVLRQLGHGSTIGLPNNRSKSEKSNDNWFISAIMKEMAQCGGDWRILDGLYDINKSIVLSNLVQPYSCPTPDYVQMRQLKVEL